MYKHHKTLALILFTLVILSSYQAELRISDDFVSHLITFFSIVFGFFLTGLSILFGSNYSKRLRQEEDSRKKTQTKLHTLKAYFKFSSLTSLSSIVLLLTMSLLGITNIGNHASNFKCMTVCNITVYCEQLLTSITLGLAAINIMFMCLLYRVFLNGFLEEGKHYDQE